MIEPVVKDIRVPVKPDEAFRRFTEDLGDWWPRDTHSVNEERCVRVGLERHRGGCLYEVDEGGERHDWGLVKVFEPPRVFVFSWYPGKDPALATEVRVTFTPVGAEAALHLEHSGWEALGEVGEAIRAAYEGGWTPVLRCYAESFSGGG